MNRRGVTIIELLITVLIGAIAMFALVPPFIAEENFFRKGKRQTESQRDAQMAFRAIARAARQSQAYTVVSAGPTIGAISFQPPTGPALCFYGGSPASSQQGRLRVGPGCESANPTVLIDGVRSRVQSFTITQVVPNRLVRIRLDVSHRLRTTDPFSANELIETELYLRNGT